LGKIEARSNLQSMKLQNALLSEVERVKVFDYLLNRANRYGASKAEFFSRYGFVLEKWELLAQALLEHGQKHDVTNVTETGFGPRYQIDGQLHSPDGRAPRVRTVWQLDRGQLAPRLITAYPAES
jgi:hypothetical protein